MAGKGLMFTLQKHKKKSIFAAGVLCYGLHYATQRYREYLIRREYFSEAKTYGDQIISPLDKPRRLYVILNPTAGNGKCKALFQKNAAPILNLAGIDVTFIQTDYEGHAKTTINYFDLTIDGVVVAGGDGVLQEVVTGMFRQPEEENVVSLPIGFIPFGNSSNFMHKKLFSSDAVHIRAICKAAMAIVKGYSKETSVMEIMTDQKPIYALSNIHFGVHQQVKDKIDAGKYWLLGPFKKYFAFIWRTVQNWPPSFSINLSCPLASPSLALQTEVVNINTKEDLVHDHLLNCNVNGSSLLNTVNINNNNNQFNGITDNFSLYLHEKNNLQQEPYLLIQKIENDQPRIDFIKFGWEWMKNKFDYTPCGNSETIICTEVAINPPDGEDLSYGIDGEIYDARPITVRVHPRKLNIFCNPDT